MTRELKTKPGQHKEVLTDLRSQLAGELITKSDVDYETERKVYNGMIDKYPLAIAKCTSVSDVVACVNIARANDLLVAVRSGGHHAAGLGVYDNALVIDLSVMRSIKIDAEKKEVLVDSGCTQGEVDRAASEHRLAVPSGIVSTTGIAGLTLGGGHGYLTRKYGLTIDNLIEAEVVLADGTVVNASERENADLFWAIRGGGGNFGIVTSFRFRAYPVREIYGGPMLWTLDKAEEMMRWYRDFIKQAPNDLYGFFTLEPVPDEEPFPEELRNEVICGVVWCYLGPMEDAESVFKPIREMAPPDIDMVGPMPLTVLNSMFDDLTPPGLQWYWKGDFVKDLPDEAIEIHAEFARRNPSSLSCMHLYPINGAVHDIAADETAFSYRDATWSMVIAGVDEDPANKDKITKWAKMYWEALHPYSCGAAYVNFMMEEGQSRVERAYRGNYERLRKIKTKYDPTNLFRVNQNILPEE